MASSRPQHVCTRQRAAVSHAGVLGEYGARKATGPAAAAAAARAASLDAPAAAGQAGAQLPQWWAQFVERGQQWQAGVAAGGRPAADKRVSSQPHAPARPHARQHLLALATGACCLAHPAKRHYGGEDAYFVSPAGGGALGVADGVGGWAEANINPAAYARAIMRVACAYLEGQEGERLAAAAADGAASRSADSSFSAPGSGAARAAAAAAEEGEAAAKGAAASAGEGAAAPRAARAYAYGFSAGVPAAAAEHMAAAWRGSGGGGGGGGGGGRPEAAPQAAAARLDPRGALDAAHGRARCAGSATACVIQLDQSRRRLVAANLGDSGFIVVRDGVIVARSRPLQHWFDCPYQLGAYPEFVEATDYAAQADMFDIPVQPGDVIVAGSDGLWDNAYDSDILELLPKGPDGAQAAAEAIAAMARAHASNPEFPSPYTREALQQGYDLSWFDKLRRLRFTGGRLRLGRLTGGKMDDVTVLVSVVDGRGA